MGNAYDHQTMGRVFDSRRLVCSFRACALETLLMVPPSYYWCVMRGGRRRSCYEVREIQRTRKHVFCWLEGSTDERSTYLVVRY